MRRKGAAWLFPLLLVGGWMWLYQLRFTPASAARSVPSVKGAVVETARFPGGTAVLLQDGARYFAVATCRWGLILWRPCNTTKGHSGNGQVLRLDLRSGRMYAYPRTSGDGFSPVWEPDGRHALHGWGLLFRLDTRTGEVEPLDLGFPAIRIGDSAPDGRLLVQAHADGSECWVTGRQAHQ